MDQRPIGVFDSGLGGLSVLAAIQSLLPDQHYIYLADSVNQPYGSKSDSEVAHLASQAVTDLIERDCKLIIFACNTASTLVVEQLRARYPDVPMVAVVPMLKPAAALTKTGTVAVLATAATLSGSYYASLKQRFAATITVVDLVGDGWVELVEQGQSDGPGLAGPVHRAVSAGADVLVLGCTHYPFLAKAITGLVGNQVTILESGPAVARQVQRVLKAVGALGPTRKTGIRHPITAPQNATGRTLYVATGDPKSVTFAASRLLGKQVIFKSA